MSLIDVASILFQAVVLSFISSVLNGCSGGSLLAMQSSDLVDSLNEAFNANLQSSDLPGVMMRCAKSHREIKYYCGTCKWRADCKVSVALYNKHFTASSDRVSNACDVGFGNYLYILKKATVKPLIKCAYVADGMTWWRLNEACGCTCSGEGCGCKNDPTTAIQTNCQCSSASQALGTGPREACFFKGPAYTGPGESSGLNSSESLREFVEASAEYDRSSGSAVMGYNEIVLGARGMIEKLQSAPASLFEAFVIPKQYCNFECAQEVIQKRDSYSKDIPIISFDASNIEAPFQPYEEPGMDDLGATLVDFHSMDHGEALEVFNKHLGKA